MANAILGTRSPNGNVSVLGVIDSGELSMLSAGALSGFSVTAGAGYTLVVGGTSGVQDCAVVRNTSNSSDLLVGNGASMTFTLTSAPATSGQSRTDALVVWKDTTVTSTLNNGLDAVGYQVVNGIASTTGTHQPPNESAIRAAIPNGAAAFYAVIAYSTLAFGAVNSASAQISRVQSRINAANAPISDTGWIPLTLNTTAGAGFNVYNAGLAPAYRIKDGYVTVTGAVSPNSARVINTAQTILTLPLGIRPTAPSNPISQLNGASTTHRYNARLSASGVLSAQLYINYDGVLPTVATSAYMPFYFIYAHEG